MSTRHPIDEGTDVIHEATPVSVSRLAHRAALLATFHQPLDSRKADGDQVFQSPIARPGTQLREQLAQGIRGRASLGSSLHCQSVAQRVAQLMSN